MLEFLSPSEKVCRTNPGSIHYKIWNILCKTCGYLQIVGESFNDIFSPVSKDVTCRLLLIAMLVWNLDYCLIDVLTAFLDGNLNEKVCGMPSRACPKKRRRRSFIIKVLSGLVQAARHYFLRFVKILNEARFERSNVELCLLFKTVKTWNCYDGEWIGQLKMIHKPTKCLRHFLYKKDTSQDTWYPWSYYCEAKRR